MASIRQLKKDVDYLAFAVIDDCLAYQAIAGEVSPELLDIIQSTILFRNSVRTQINAKHDFADPKARKVFYRELTQNLLSTIDEHFTRLSQLIQKG